MRSLWKPLVIAASMLALAVAAAPFPGPVRAAPEDEISLLQTLAAWQYPGTDIHGAQGSDGGYPGMPSVKLKAVLTTPDPIEKVIAFYTEKLGTGEPGARAEASEVKQGEAKAVSVQDDSRGRPVTLRVFAVHKADSSTTLVISRAEGEKATHIAWSHYLRFPRDR
jgi:hypothetical protein